MKKGCELCAKPARMYCDSDQARLCWDYDERVHRANFLVAKHTRSLLCHVCQSPIPWKASRAKLGLIFFVCDGYSTTSYTKGPQSSRRDPEDEETESSVGEDSDDSNQDDYNDSDDYTSEEG